jgi:primase-polymerase (primpol)-like protein
MIDLNLACIPAELKQTHRWVLWGLCDVQDGSKLRKSCKVPFSAKDGSPASHSDLNTWTSFEVALTAHNSNLTLNPPENVVTMHDTRGLGMVLGKPFFGKDFDQCIVDGVMDPEVEAELAELNTYAELSQSGTGVHVIGHGEPPYLEGHRRDGREIYSCNRFFVMTGNVIGDYKEVRRFTPVEVAAMYAKVKAGKKEFKPLSAKLAELMTSIDFPDKSEAVMSLLTQLAYQNCDPSFIETEFKKSKLYSDTHWQERWPRLGASQITKAIAWVNTHPRREQATEMELVVSDADKAEVKRTTWLWKGWLSRGDVHGSFGDSKEGKSPVWTDIAAVLTTGRAFPDGAANENGPGYTFGT